MIATAHLLCVGEEEGGRCMGAVFSRFFFRKNYLLLSCATSVRPSVEIISFRSSVFRYLTGRLISKLA